MRTWEGTWKAISLLPPRPWSSLHPQMGTDAALLEGPSALLGGNVCTGNAGGRQPGPSSGLSSGEARMVPWNSNTRVLVLTPPFKSHTTLTESLNLSQPKNRNSFIVSIFHAGCSEYQMKKKKYMRAFCKLHF